MNVKTDVQTKLDNCLLQYGILSHHIRRIKTDKIEGKSVRVNIDEYVVYRLSCNPKSYGDGNTLLTKRYIDVTYYYSHEKNDPRTVAAEKRVQDIINAFVADKRYRVVNGQSDLPDVDNEYRGINVEFSFIGAAGDV